MANVNTITLSYTFFEAPQQPDKVSAVVAPKKPEQTRE
jgi:cytochrome c oxidase assembly protein Cox11